MTEEDQFKEALKKVVRSSHDKIASSKIFLTLFTENMHEDPVPVLQLGMAILMNKPIAVLALDDVEVPGELKKLSFAVERAYRGNSDSMEAATRAILEKSKKL